MSVREMARELYRVVKRLQALEKEVAQLQRCGSETKRLACLQQERLALEAERRYLKSLLDGARQ